MQKEDYGVECKICVRPFTIFRWKAGTKGRYKVRDKYLEEAGQSKVALPFSRVGRDYALQEQHKSEDGADLPYGKIGPHPMLQRLARMTPYYKRNETRICTFYTKGQCNRGNDCPFKHELPQGGELANQKLRDRFHGENDPLAAKIIRQANEEMELLPPEDKSITTLYLGSLEPGVTEKDIRDQFYVFGEIRSIRMAPKQACAFVTFKEREVAEEAARKLYRILVLKGKRVALMWGRPQPTAHVQASGMAVAGSSGTHVPPMFPPVMPMTMNTYRPYYPSMDPSAMGNAPLEGEIPDKRPVPIRSN